MDDWELLNDWSDADSPPGEPSAVARMQFRREMKWMVPPSAVATLILWGALCALSRVATSGVRSLVRSVYRRSNSVGEDVNVVVETAPARVAERPFARSRDAMRT